MKVPPLPKQHQKKGSHKMTPPRRPQMRVQRGAGYREPWPEPSGSLGSRAVAFSPSKNNSSERGKRRAPNWNQLSKLPAGSGFRSLHQPFWERAIKNSEGLKAPSLLPILPLPGEDMESRVWRAGVSPCSTGKDQQGLEQRRRGWRSVMGGIQPPRSREKGGSGAGVPPGRAAGAIPAFSPACCQRA